MGSRYVLGWGAVLALAVGASAGTLVLVRQAIGDGNLTDPLSQSQVRSQYAGALRPTPTSTTTPGAGSTSTSAIAPRSTPSGTGSQRPGTPPTSTPPGGHGDSTSTGSHSPPRGSGSSSTSHPSPPPSSVSRVLTSPGGSVVVRCTAGTGQGPDQVYLVSWSPAQGYAVNHAQRGPGEEAEIEFESDQSTVSVGYHCTSSGPVQEVETGDAWGGGGDDGGDGGGGDS